MPNNKNQGNKERSANKGKQGGFATMSKEQRTEAAREGGRTHAEGGKKQNAR